MDDIVKQALVRWPNVPHCTGWLLLDARGNWRMRDEAAQAQHESGTPIRHDALLGFINRNYEHDESGQWYFQNGPQRVYVELEYTPWIVRLAVAPDGTLALTDQAGAPFTPVAAWLDEAGSILFADDKDDVALLHDHDLDLLTEHATIGDEAHNGTFSGTFSGTFHWRADVALPLQPIQRAEVPARFHFVASPANAASATDAANAANADHHAP